MFKFNFDIEDVEEIPDLCPMNTTDDAQNSSEICAESARAQEFREIPIQQLIDSLPPIVSYSPLTIPLSQNRSLKSLTFVRRDLFDARFQLISEGKEQETGETEDESTKTEGTNSSYIEGDATATIRFLDAPSDLVPGVYEGGLKTWECALDLVDYLDSQIMAQGNPDLQPGDIIRKKWSRVLEIGCGTGIPSIYLLHRLFSVDSSCLPGGNTECTFHLHLQDFNPSVLELMTLPNILLNWYLSPASKTYRDATPADQETDAPEFPDPHSPGELHITPELKAAFYASLQSLGVSLRFFSGAWESLDLERIWSNEGDKADPSAPSSIYDLVMTSETIYRMDSLPSLISLLRRASRVNAVSDINLTQLGQLVNSKLDLEGTITHSKSRIDYPKDTTFSTKEHHCLVAAKVLYFGVGGGVSEFIKAVEGGGRQQGISAGEMGASLGSVSTVWEHNVGVGRRIMQVKWN